MPVIMVFKGYGNGWVANRCGFRPLEEIVRHLSDYPELRSLVTETGQLVSQPPSGTTWTQITTCHVMY